MALLGLVPQPGESVLASAERSAFDAQMRLLRAWWPRPIAGDVVLIGIDEATRNTFTDPMALWHRHFAEVSHALARVKPRAVGIDVVPPERSYEHIVPGADLAMMRGIVDLKRSTRLVYVQTVSERGELTPVQPNLRGLLPPEALGLDQQLKDPDGVSRRFSESELSAGATPVPTFAGQLLRQLALPLDEGYIDYSLGEPVAYVPMHDLLRWDDTRLAAVFGGRVVLLGNVTRETDRWPPPVKLTSQALASPGALAYSQPGVTIHLQVLRSHFAGGLLHPLRPAIAWILAALAAAVVLLRTRPVLMLMAAVIVPALLLAGGLFAIVAWRTLLPIALLVATFWTALAVRAVFDAAEAIVERVRLQRSFAGQVSPAVLREMLAGALSPGVSGQLAEVCVLFSDVRDFTTLSENMPASVVTDVLQRYFDRMVNAVHRFDGTVDKFIGDGMMVLFGAPRSLADPCGDAVQCALAMMAELDALNADFAREGLPTLVIGIGINYGTVTVGNIGSTERHNYSAIGDAVNVAARVEGLTKELGRKIIITEAVVSRIEGRRFHFDPLGSHKVKGHSPVQVWGIRTAYAVPAKAQAEAMQ